MKKVLALTLAIAMFAVLALACAGNKDEQPSEPTAEPVENPTDAPDAAAEDKAKADEVAALIDAIYVQERTADTDAQCAAAKAAWDALTDAQKELVEGENADPDYFGRDTGDASLDDPRNADGIGENELLVVSFGTSFNGSRAADIGGIEAPTGRCAERSPRRSSSTTCRRATASSSTTWIRRSNAQFRTASRTSSCSRRI